ncbi:MAG TPA: ATP-dependent DNA ligase, partial [Candidatus Aenigmarchaeota archaeon]|nr:ATP-dependent DNA ligase [Candidatus Aenigmarchaeota archaeon]
FDTPHLEFYLNLYEKLGATTKKLEKIEIIANFIKNLKKNELKFVIPLIQGKIFSESEEEELGIANNLVVLALTKLGFSKEEILEKFKEKGDLGLVAQELVRSKRQITLFKKNLTVEQVYSSIREIAKLTGKNSQEKKLNIILELVNSSSPLEACYAIRIILGELRLGIAEGIVRDAIAQAFNVEKDLVERAYNLTTDFSEVAIIAKEKGNNGLKEVKLEIGKPTKVMLAEKAENLEKALEDAKEPTIEFKYDGMRTLIQKEKDKIWLFTRRLENITKQFPDLVELCKNRIKVEKAILEGETIGIKNGKTIPFQELSKRIHRKYEINKMVNEIPIQINLFDCLLVDNEQLINKPFNYRRKKLEEIIEPINGKFQLAEQMRTKDLKKAEEFYHRALNSGQEGVMVKNLNAPYQPGKRVGYMYKVKPEKESLDLVIVGAEWGQGRRATWLASFILAVRDEETGELLEIGKMGTGLTDEQFKEMTSRLRPLIEFEKDNIVHIKPKIVVEVGYQELQKSTNYKSGFALRFPKLIRIRDDKGVDEADTLERIKKLYSQIYG